MGASVAIESCKVAARTMGYPSAHHPSSAVRRAVGRTLWALAAAVGLAACARAPMATRGQASGSHGSCDGFEREVQRFWSDSEKQQVRAAIVRATGDYAAALAARVTNGMDVATSKWVETQKNACIDAVARKTTTPEAYAMVAACLRVSLASEQTIAKAMRSPTRAEVFDLDDVMAWLTRDPAQCLIEPVYVAYTPRESDRVAIVAAREGKATSVATATTGTSDLDAAQHALGEAWAYAPIEAGPRWAAAIDRGIAAARRSKDPKVLAELLLSDARRLEEFDFKPEAALERAREAERLARQAGYDEGLRGSYYRFGSVSSEQGKHREAIDWFKKALELTEKTLGKEHKEAGFMHSHLASAYGQLDRNEKMLALHRTSFTILEKSLGANEIDTAIACDNVAAAYEERDKHASALEWYRKALAIKEGLVGPDHPLLARSQLGISSVYVARREHDTALEWIQKTVVLLEKTLGKDHPATATGYASMADVYGKQQKYVEAIEMYLRALAIREKAPHIAPAEVAQTHNEIAMVYVEQDKHAEALGEFEKALAIQKKGLGRDSEAAGTSCQNICTMRYKLGDPATAVQSCLEAFGIFEKVLGTDHKTTKATYDDIDFLCLDAKQQSACDFVHEHTKR
jgi:tetratricopeptide (TPR) repeat protein